MKFVTALILRLGAPNARQVFILRTPIVRKVRAVLAY